VVSPRLSCLLVASPLCHQQAVPGAHAARGHDPCAASTAETPSGAAATCAASAPRRGSVGATGLCLIGAQRSSCGGAISFAPDGSRLAFSPNTIRVSAGWAALLSCSAATR
jgi:hypothetical protein